MVTDPGQLPPEMKTQPPGRACARYLDALAEFESPGLTPRRARGKESRGAEHDPIVWAEALGANVTDADGNRFLDLTAGFGAAAVGHRHPRVVQAVRQQADRLLHALGDLHPAEVKIRLLERLANKAPFEQARVVLGLSGSDAVEAALKSALLATDKPGVLASEGGYHGLSYGTLAVGGYKSEFRRPFAAQLNPAVCFAAFPASAPKTEEPVLLSRAVDAVRACFRSAPTPVGAVLVEPIQGRAGVREPVSGFLRALGSLCREQGALLIADEIFTGLGRSGAIWRSVQEVTPDIICAGKALGGGLPVSACIGRPEVMQAWGRQGDEALYAGTFFGHPLCCAAALAALGVIDDEGLVERSRETGDRLKQMLQTLAAVRPGIRQVRGQGLMIGVELDRAGAAVRLAYLLLQRGYLTVPAGVRSEVLSLTPPLNIDPELLQGFTEILGDCLEEMA
jgi:4-aminobutyrate aminotransferase/(S)-3-amino-2-methylpropionate transaminase